MGAVLFTLLSSPFRFLKGIISQSRVPASDVTVDVNESSLSVSEDKRDTECAVPDSPQRFSLCNREFSPSDRSLQSLADIRNHRPVPFRVRMEDPAEKCLEDSECAMPVEDSSSSCNQDIKIIHKAPTVCVHTYRTSSPPTPDHIIRKCEQYRSNTYIQRQFGRICTETYKLLKARYTLNEFKIHLMEISPSDEVSNEISQAESYTKALIAVHHLWSWDDYCVFKELILAFGDADAMQQLDLYDQEMMQYLADKEIAECDHEDQSSQVHPSYYRQNDVIIYPQRHFPSNCQDNANEDNQESTDHPVVDQGNLDFLSHPSFTNHRSSSERAFIQSLCDDKLKQKSSEDVFCEDQRLKGPLWCHDMTPSNKTPETV